MGCLYVSVIRSSLLLVCVYLVVGERGGNITHRDNDIIQVSSDLSENKWFNLSRVSKLTANRMNPRGRSEEKTNTMIFHRNDSKISVSLSSFAKNQMKSNVKSSIASSGSSKIKELISQGRMKRNTDHETRCNSLPTRKCSGVSVQYASFCPWHYARNIDDMREPSIIYEAVCDCDRPYTPFANANIRCEQITSNITVKRFTSQGTWNTEYKMVSKGCTPVLSCHSI